MIFTLHEAGKSQKYIAEFLEAILAQVKYTISNSHLSPRKNKGACPKLNSMQVDELETSVCSSHKTRQMS